ncbi:KAE1 threonylcarbamoyltransferase, partial [Copsychus sechellarum]|nr:KAE1 threonylcarbamoyltransferase [Copsychus sechellarum]
QVIAWGGRRYRILGETLDVAVGNGGDRLARLLQVRHAHPKATGGQPRPPGHVHPATPTLTRGGFPQIPNAPSPGYNETAFAMLAEVTERALALTRARHLLLVGGVAC